MTPIIAVALQTYRRVDYTERTVRAFARFNAHDPRFVFVHADDASPERREIRRLVKRHGYTTVLQGKRQRGAGACRTALLAKAAQWAPWVLLLENDCEAVRPFPWDLFTAVASDPSLYCLRLHGVYKDAAAQEACLTVDKWSPSRPTVAWRPMPMAPEPAERARIHWSAQPSVTRSDALLLAGHRERERETARVVSNVFVHIGSVRSRELVA